METVFAKVNSISVCRFFSYAVVAMLHLKSTYYQTFYLNLLALSLKIGFFIRKRWLNYANNWFTQRFHSYLKGSTEQMQLILILGQQHKSRHTHKKHPHWKQQTCIKMSTTSASCIFSMVDRSLIQMRACALFFKLFSWIYQIRAHIDISAGVWTDLTANINSFSY